MGGRWELDGEGEMIPANVQSDRMAGGEASRSKVHIFLSCSEISTCCNSPVRVAGGGTGTGATMWYECERCQMPCDAGDTSRNSVVRDKSAFPSIIPKGTIATLETKRTNGIKPMVEIVSDDGKTIAYRGLFGGTKIKRSRRDRIASIHIPNAQDEGPMEAKTV